jgi:hypothetical protein
MRKKKLIKMGKTASMMLSALAIMITSCEGPAGPPGADANETCKQCHNDGTDLFAAQDYQYQASVHATGGHSERANRGDCALCHSHEGFMQYLANDKDREAVEPQPGATQPQCKTCHMVHTNYDTTDYQLRTTEPVDLWISDATVDYGKGNMCTNCHQPRVPNPLPEKGGGDVTITSPFWGIHHGPQSALVAGTSAYPFGNDEYASTNAHYTQAPLDSEGCVQCHMATGYGQQSGGHTMKMAYDDHGDVAYNIDGCLDCHNEDIVDAIGEEQGIIAGKLETLKDLLLTEGFIAENGRPDVSFGGPGLTLTADEAGALLNYKLIEEDRSAGIHNPAYINDVLDATITFMQNK